MENLKLKRLLYSIVTFFIFGVAVAQEDVTPEWQKNAMEWMQGGSVAEDWFMKDFLQGYKAIVWGEYGTFIDMAKIIGLIMCTIYFGIKSYEMFTGDKKLDILPLLRPFGLCLILVFWKPFIETISMPTDLIASVASAKYDEQQRTITMLRYNRANVQSKVIDLMFTAKADLDSDTSTDQTWYYQLGSGIKEGVKEIMSPILEMKQRLEFQIQLFFTQLLETVALWILRIATYGLFLLQIVYSGILIMLGPFSVAMAIHPAFKDSFLTWISRFISVNLYLGVGYIVLFITGILQKYALESEIKKYEQMIIGDELDMTKYIYMQSNGIMSFGTVIIAFFLSVVAIVSVPSISTWIVSTSGVTSAVSTASRAGGYMAGKATGMIMGKK